MSASPFLRGIPASFRSGSSAARNPRARNRPARGRSSVSRVRPEDYGEETIQDASEALITIARARVPAADIRVGDMFALPFDDDCFDVATSFNGIWKGCEDALREARRVVRPGGLVGFTFWGAPKRLGLLPFFATLVELSPPSHVDATLNQGDTGRPGVAEQMLADVGLEFVDRGTAQVVTELPDLDLAIRALASSGPSWPALQAVGYDMFAEKLREAIRPLCTEGLGVRIVSEFGWIMGRVPRT